MKVMNRIIVLFLSCLLTALSTLGQTYSYSKDLEKKAKKGDPEAQTILGYCYYKGLECDVKQDISAAKLWLWRAANQDYPPAQQLYANICYEELNFEEAAKWYEFAAKKGREESQYMLAWMYFHGQGKDQNQEEAVYWYKQAAEQGFANAQSDLGYCYKEGLGVPKDINDAIKWYQKAANQGFETAQNSLGICYTMIEPCDYKQAVYWFQKAAENGNVSAQYNLGEFYKRGCGVKQDYRQAVYWFNKAANEDIAEAQYALGLCYYRGDGVSPDYSKAFNLFSKASNTLEMAHQMIGIMYFYGYGVEQNYEKAFYHLQDLVLFGNDIKIGGYENTQIKTFFGSNGDYFNEAMELLQNCYRFGRGTEKNIEKADFIFELAQKYENENAKETARILLAE